MARMEPPAALPTAKGDVTLPPLLSSMVPTPSLSPQCLCCNQRMSWQDWAQYAWLSGSSRHWSSICEDCHDANDRFSAAFRSAPPPLP
jgi:hypothetical protein